MTGVVLAPLSEYDRSIGAATAMRPVGTVSIATCYCFIVCRLCAIPEGCTDSIHTAWRDENARKTVSVVRKRCKQMRLRFLLAVMSY